ncbi:ABC transporter permease [Kitasatospora terrestris]|uniref:ABC transporter permease n=1 Tax=Kitasatospora terrestris TaxID=258051 RepID=A0ABP9DGV4_9ACTN
MLRTVALRNVLAHRSRLLMTVLAVCLGVAFVSGTLVFAESAAAAHRAAATRDFAGIAVTVNATGPDSVLDDALAHRLATVPGVASVRPAVDGTAVLAKADGSPLRVRAGANLAAAYPPDAGRPAEGRAPAGADEIAVDRGTADAGGFRLGDTVSLATDGPVLHKHLVGIVTTRDSRVTAGGTLVLFDRATAQRLFSAPGRYTSIDLSATPGTSETELAQRIGSLLPPDRAEVTTAAARAAQQAVYVDTLTRGYRKMPLVFAGVALFIGSFLVVNTFSMLVTRRARETALLRAIGATRGQVVRSVLAEASLTGLLASAAGYLLGLGIAAVLPDLLATGGAPLPHSPLVLGPRPVAAALAVGVGVTVLAAWLPARRAARVAPVEALRTDHQPPATGHRLRALAGAVLLVLSACLLVPLGHAEDASEANLRTALLGCGLLVTALIALAPLLAVPVIRLIGRLTDRLGIAGRLAAQNALRDPRRTAATAATLLISTALVSGLAVVGHSTGRALDRQAAAGLGADHVVSTGSRTTGIDSDTVRRVAGTPGVRTAAAVADSTLVIGGHVRTVSGVEPNGLSDVMTLDVTSGSTADLGPGRIAVSTTVARESGLTTGSRVTAALGQNRQPTAYTVVAVYRDNPTAQDALAARADVQRDAYLPGSVQRILLRTDGTTDRQLRTAVGDNPLLKVQGRGELVREAAGTLGDLLTLMYGLLVLGAVISALGLANTLAVSVAERTRELGVLRALGTDRATVRRTVRLEAVTVAVFGTLLGLAAGLVSARSVGALANGAVPGYTLAFPWGTLLLVALAAPAIGALAATLPAHRAATLSPLEATTAS